MLQYRGTLHRPLQRHTVTFHIRGRLPEIPIETTCLIVCTCTYDVNQTVGGRSLQTGSRSAQR